MARPRPTERAIDCRRTQPARPQAWLWSEAWFTAAMQAVTASARPVAASLVAKPAQLSSVKALRAVRPGMCHASVVLPRRPVATLRRGGLASHVVHECPESVAPRNAPAHEPRWPARRCPWWRPAWWRPPPPAAACCPRQWWPRPQQQQSRQPPRRWRTCASPAARPARWAARPAAPAAPVARGMPLGARCRSRCRQHGQQGSIVALPR